MKATLRAADAATAVSRVSADVRLDIEAMVKRLGAMNEKLNATTDASDRARITDARGVLYDEMQAAKSQLGILERMGRQLSVLTVDADVELSAPEVALFAHARIEVTP
jgi:hypothetical protein